ncbi:hypothetical protein CDAR_76791 [Caerostris darwini]|uniref:Uncharacterized protein n=1 Tax=Caerostris darwini TaxID=1538125 RepID=A0AAV4QFI2_9ARAC|nr:hypothetical protein CDAR_76791 [Caerostris darwini]
MDDVLPINGNIKTPSFFWSIPILPLKFRQDLLSSRRSKTANGETEIRVMSSARTLKCGPKKKKKEKSTYSEEYFDVSRLFLENFFPQNCPIFHLLQEKTQLRSPCRCKTLYHNRNCLFSKKVCNTKGNRKRASLSWETYKSEN